MFSLIPSFFMSLIARPDLFRKLSTLMSAHFLRASARREIKPKLRDGLFLAANLPVKNTILHDAIEVCAPYIDTCEKCGPLRGLSGPHIVREGLGGRACASLSIGYQRFLKLNLSFMPRLVRACVKDLKTAQIIPSTAEQEKMVGVQPCNLSTP
jgi:hypothetical protein